MKYFAVVVGVLFSFVLLVHSLCLADFERPAGLEPAIQFWTKVYSQYSTKQGVFHDRHDVSRVYVVISLIEPSVPGSYALNKARKKIVLRQIKKSFRRFRTGKPAESSLDRRVYYYAKQMSKKDLASASDNIRMQLGQSDRFRAGVIRSAEYMRMIQKEFRNHGLPEELAYLPHVESSFRPDVYSNAGAAGLWQFIPSTGRYYGLKVTKSFDERLDPYYSSEAAAKLLADNYKKLQSWPFALTAYNHGVSGMMRAKAKHADYMEVVNDYSSKSFGFASRNFYAEFLAARDVAKRLEKEMRIHYKSADLVTVTFKKSHSARVLAKYFSLSLDEFKKLNPAVRKMTARTMIRHEARIHVPYTVAGRAKKEPGTKRRRLLASNADSPYCVQPGDTLSSIARRHKTTVQQLKKLNGLSASMIYPRECLRLR